MSATHIAQPINEMEIDQLCINTIRTLSIDAVQQAKSGHPGTPMALAPLVYTMWNRVMHFDPQDPIWPNRDRFVLSNGHASMLLWSMLHLTKTQAVNAEYESLGQPSVTLDHQRGHGHRAEMACESLQPSGLRNFQLQHLCRLRRRLPDGRHFVGSSIARRSSGPG